MQRAFLYIDILGFENLVRTKPAKVDKIFNVFDSLRVHRHHALKTIVFSDTILVFNKDDSWPLHYYCTYLIEYVQDLFYRLCSINVYCKAILTHGEFNYSKLKNIEGYYGLTLIDAYNDEKNLPGFGLYMDRSISDHSVMFEKTSFSSKYDYVFLCQSIVNLYNKTSGSLPVDLDLFSETDEFYRIDEDLRFLREIDYLRRKHPTLKVRDKYQLVYDIYKSKLPRFFHHFENNGFLPFVLNKDYAGNINPFELISERES